MKAFLKLASSAIAALAVSAVLLTADVSPQQKYIDKWKETAVDEMYRSGVPASITLAQGMLESRYGLSELAAVGNNHFGIKCHDWKGRSMKVDDDRKGECFRVYDTAEQSFRDHSDFLRFRDRYKSLFNLEISDYKGWAYGLSKAGYATDPAYPAKLIRIIEEYGLSRYDEGLDIDYFENEPTKEDEPKGEDVKKDSGRKPSSHARASTSHRQGKARASHNKGRSADKSRNTRQKSSVKRTREARVLPEPPLELEEVVEVPASRAEEVFHVSLDRKVYTKNGVAFVYSEEGEDYASIAEEYNLFTREILKFNDLSSARPLAPGTVVYVKSKKKQAAEGMDKYIVENDGEQLRDICQRFAVTMKSVCKRNSFAEGHVLREGDTILLR